MDLLAQKTIDYEGVKKILPHRFPYLLIDKIVDFTLDEKVTAIKNIGSFEPLLLEPNQTTYPSWLVIESLGQAAIALYFLGLDLDVPTEILMGSISDVEIYEDMPVNASLRLEACIDKKLDNGIIFSGRAYNDEKLILEVGSLVAILKEKSV